MPWSLAPLLHLRSCPLEPSSQTPQLPCPSQDHGPLPSSPKAQPQCCPLPGLAYVGEMGWVPHAKPPPSQVAWGPAQPCQAEPLTSACPLPPAKTGPPGTTCSLSCSLKFVVCGFLLAGSTPPGRPRPVHGLPQPFHVLWRSGRKILETQELKAFPGWRRGLLSAPPWETESWSRASANWVCHSKITRNPAVILELPSPTLQTATHTDVQC